jgi:hypothetical protein
MSKSFKKPKPNDHRNQVARSMIIEKVGVNASGPMRDKRQKRVKNPKRDWRGEDYSE